MKSYSFSLYIENLNLLPGNKYYYQVEQFWTFDQVLNGPTSDLIVPLPNLIMDKQQSNIVRENFTLSWKYATKSQDIKSYCEINFTIAFY